MFSTGKSHVPGLTDFTEVLVGQVVGVNRDTLHMLPHTAWERCEERGGGEGGREKGGGGREENGRELEESG